MTLQHLSIRTKREDLHSYEKRDDVVVKVLDVGSRTDGSHAGFEFEIRGFRDRRVRRSGSVRTLADVESHVDRFFA